MKANGETGESSGLQHAPYSAGALPATRVAGVEGMQINIAERWRCAITKHFPSIGAENRSAAAHLAREIFGGHAEPLIHVCHNHTAVADLLPYVVLEVAQGDVVSLAAR